MEEKAEPSVDRGGLSPREIVSVANLGRRFGTKQAVSDISFCVEQNEVFALLGPNGSGKSTLLRMLCGFLQPSSGDIQIMGHCLLSEPRQAKAAIGYVPDQGGLYLHQSVRQFLDFVSAAKNIPINERKDRLDYVVTTLQLHEVLDSAISTLSQGYRQRVSLAQALLNRPKIILMDEPTNGLDPAQLRHWRDLMSSLKKDCTIIFTSHVLNEVSSLADRVGFLVDGKLVSIESLRETAQNLLLKIDKDSLPILQGNAHADITTVTELGEGMLEVAIVISACSTAEVITDFVGEGGRLHEAKSAQVDLEALFFHAMESSAQQAPITSNLTRGR